MCKLSWGFDNNPLLNFHRRNGTTGLKGDVFQIRLVLPSVAEMYPSGCNLQFDILRHNAGKVLRFQNNHSLLKVSLFAHIC